MGSRKRITFALIGLVVLVVAGWLIRDASSGSSPGPAHLPGHDSGLPVTALSQLPPEATATWRLIEKGGPFPSTRDGATFENREKRLPVKARDYYREYTVPTPGSDDRGARRLVHGQESELYYTENHYDSFVLVDPGK
ncbi:ribonuclease domain-containing protein [Kibdelosporangium persicum]|uniref:Guanyl-specific ribonuclease Sa n=1 Tax=Kibdelosporangium persicum TaxID=2698649 RepID=A0ABX2F5X3_9PSEU|nr:ribonuclease domain-containing protein [Kibdelosporangium persicum]NRN66774.1 Guanyl-specific ribonuclease Sa [Kibdelosporangium persicum]